MTDQTTQIDEIRARVDAGTSAICALVFHNGQWVTMDPMAVGDRAVLLAEVDRLAAEHWNAFGLHHKAEHERMSAAIEQVRELHEPGTGDALFDRHCIECSEPEIGYAVKWPCDTFRALDGDTDDE